MFTGLVETTTVVERLQLQGTGLRLDLRRPPGEAWNTRGGESLSVSGACLTALAGGAGSELSFDLSLETLEKTWFRALEVGRSLNLERAMRLSDRLDGHLVSGHVDGVGRVVSVEDWGDGGRRLGFEAPAGFERYLVDKGSATLDGVSLTVIGPVGRRFEVALIPTTLGKTTLGTARVGTPVNFEADLIGKWVERFVRR